MPVHTGGGDGLAFSDLKHREVEGLNRGRDKAAENAFYIRLSRIRDLRIAVAFQVLQHVDEVIDRRERDILDLDFIFLVSIEISFGGRNRRSRSIVNIPVDYMIGRSLRGCCSRIGIGQLIQLQLNDVGVEENLITGLFTGIGHIVALDRQLIDLNVAEHRDGGHVAGNDRFGGDYRLSGVAVFIRQYPLLEDLAGHERILGHLANGLAGGAEVLGETLLGLVVMLHDEVHGIHIGEHRRDRHIAGHRCANGNLIAVLVDPLVKLLAFDRGFRGKLQLFVLIICIGRVNVLNVFAVLQLQRFERNGEDVLLIRGPDIRVAMYRHHVGEIALSVHPPAKAAALGGNRRHIVHAVVGIRGDRLGGQDLRFGCILIEGHRISDLFVIRTDGQIRGDRNGAGSNPRGWDPFAILAALPDFAVGPVCDVILTLNQIGGRQGDLRPVVHRPGFQQSGVSVIELDRPYLDIGRFYGHIRRRDRFCIDFFIIGHPLVKAIAFHFGCSRKRADG